MDAVLPRPLQFLIIRFSSIGDLVLTSPVIRCLHNQFPDAKIHFLIKKKFLGVMKNNPHIDQFHIFDYQLKATLKELKKENFDFVIDLQKNFRSYRIRKALGAPWFTFSKLDFEKWLLVRFKIDRLPDKSVVDRYFEAVQPIGVKNDHQGMEFFIPEKDQVDLSQLPVNFQHGYIACVIGGSYFTKRFPVEKWQEFAKQIDLPMILIGGPTDTKDGEAITQTKPDQIYNGCGQFNLNQSADLVRQAKVVISNDTGLMHIAAAFQKPIISLWGNTSPKMGMFPYYGNNNLKSHPSPLSVIMDNEELSCHPCSKIGFDKCPKGHFKCMLDLPVLKIIGAARKFWNESQPKAMS